MVQSRVDARAIGARQVRIGEPARPAGAFSDIVAGELDVHAAEMRAQLGVNAEREIELAEDVLEAPCLEAAGGCLGVAVHRIAHP